MLKRWYCRITRHKVNRRRAWHDHLNFRASCARCGAPLVRDRHGWREFDSERDASELRGAQPHLRGPAPD